MLHRILGVEPLSRSKDRPSGSAAAASVEAAWVGAEDSSDIEEVPPPSNGRSRKRKDRDSEDGGPEYDEYERRSTPPTRSNGHSRKPKDKRSESQTKHDRPEYDDDESRYNIADAPKTRKRSRRKERRKEVTTVYTTDGEEEEVVEEAEKGSEDGEVRENDREPGQLSRKESDRRSYWLSKGIGEDVDDGYDS